MKTKAFIFSLLLALCAYPVAAEDMPATQGAAPAQEKPGNPAPVEIPLDKPHLDDSSLLAWTAAAVPKTMTFSYLNYQRDMQQASKNFTKAGWESFTTALQKSRTLDSVQTNEQNVTAELASPQILIQKGVFTGRYRWVLAVPLRIKYQGAKESRTDELNMSVIVERVPQTEENPSGLGITQLMEIRHLTPVEAEDED